MDEGLQGVGGGSRRFTSAEGGGVIRMFRERQGLKRAVLAADANVSEKTIERAEAGEGISEVSCRRIARALGMKENAFTDALYIPTLEEVERIQKQNEEKIRQTHLRVPVAPIEGARDILRFFECCALFADDRNIAEQHLHDFASLKQTLVDYTDIASELSAPQQLESAQEIL